jgi:hypothetical protein
LLTFPSTPTLTCPTRGQGIIHLRSDEIRLLDTTPVAGEPGDVYAAAIDNTTHLALTLAKNGSVRSKDIDAADTLVALLSSATSAEDLLPFFSGKSKFEKRVTKICDTIKVFLTSVDDIWAKYQPLHSR